MKVKAKQNREKEEILIIGKKRLSDIMIVRLGNCSQVNYVCTLQLNWTASDYFIRSELCTYNASFLVPCM